MSTAPEDAPDEAFLRTSARIKDQKADALFESLLEGNGGNFAVVKFYGIHRYVLGDHAAAVRHLQRARDLDGADRECLLYLMRALHAGTRKDEAGRVAEAILDIDPGNAEAMRLLARHHLAARQWNEALIMWRRIAENAANDHEAALQIARLAWRLEDFDLAETSSRAMLAIQPDNFECLDICVKALHRARRYGEMAELLPQYARRDWDNAVKFLDNLDAAEVFQPLAEALAALVRVTPPLEAAVDWASRFEFRCLADAVALELREDDIGAAALYRAVLTISPENREAKSSLERLKRNVTLSLREAQKDNRPEDIVRASGELLRLDPGSDEAHFALGRLHLMQGEHEQALGHLREAVAASPENVWYQLNYGRAALNCKQYGDALGAFAMIEGAAGNVNPAYRSEAVKSIERINRVAMAEARKRIADHRFTRAAQLLDIAQQAGKDSGEVDALRDTLQRRMYSDVSSQYRENAENSLGAVEAFLALFPDEQRALVMHGRLAMQNRDFQAALQSWERAAAGAPDDAHFHLQIARCHNWLKSPAAAAAAAQKALQCDPDLQEARSIVDNFKAPQDV